MQAILAVILRFSFGMQNICYAGGAIGELVYRTSELARDRRGSPPLELVLFRVPLPRLILFLPLENNTVSAFAIAVWHSLPLPLFPLPFSSQSSPQP